MTDDLTVGRINFLSNEPLQVSLGGTPFNKAHLDARAAEIKRLETALTEARAEIERLKAGWHDCITDLVAEKKRALAAESELSTLRARVREVVGPLVDACEADYVGEVCKDEDPNESVALGSDGPSAVKFGMIYAARQLMEKVK